MTSLNNEQALTRIWHAPAKERDMAEAFDAALAEDLARETAAARRDTAEESRRTYEIGTQRLTDLDLAVNGLLDKHTMADPRSAPSAAEFPQVWDQLDVLREQARGREFTPAEQLEWQSALGSTAAHYAAEDAR